MRKTKRKIIAFTLALAMIISSASFSFAETGSGGANSNVSVDMSSNCVGVPLNCVQDDGNPLKVSRTGYKLQNYTVTFKPEDPAGIKKNILFYTTAGAVDDQRAYV